MFWNSGSTLIKSAIASFERIAKQIEDGIASNEASIHAKVSQLVALNDEVNDLAATNRLGKSVAEKLRALVS